MTPARHLIVAVVSIGALWYGGHLIEELADVVEGDPPQLYLLAWYVPFGALGVGALTHFFLSHSKGKP